MSLPGKMVLPVHFEDFDGHKFEQLVFAYFYRRWKDRWKSFDWYGEVGDDGGRDIRGVLNDDRSVLIVCGNWKKITSTKFTSDLDNAIASGGVPAIFLAICGSSVSTDIRDKVANHAKAKGVKESETWSGREFEERIRADAESLLRRFVEGVAFPDDPTALKEFSTDPKPLEPSLALGSVLCDETAVEALRDQSLIPVKILRAYLTNEQGQVDAEACVATLVAVDDGGNRRKVTPVRLAWENGAEEMTIRRGDEAYIEVARLKGGDPRYLGISGKDYSKEYADKFTAVIRVIPKGSSPLEIEVPIDLGKCTAFPSDWMSLWEAPLGENFSSPL